MISSKSFGTKRMHEPVGIKTLLIWSLVKKLLVNQMNTRKIIWLLATTQYNAIQYYTIHYFKYTRQV